MSSYAKTSDESKSYSVLSSSLTVGGKAHTIYGDHKSTHQPADQNHSKRYFKTHNNSPNFKGVKGLEM